MGTQETSLLYVNRNFSLASTCELSRRCVLRRHEVSLLTFRCEFESIDAFAQDKYKVSLEPLRQPTGIVIITFPLFGKEKRMGQLRWLVISFLSNFII